MRTILFSIGELHVYGYGFMIAVGILVAFIVAFQRAPKFGLSPDAVFNIGLSSAIAGIIGAKLLFCIVEFKSFIADPVGTLFSGSGFVVYGGLIGGIGWAVLYCRFKKYSFLEYFDLIMPSIALAQGFGRIGCFLAGCCYGKETDLPIGVIFTDSLLAPNGVRLLPTQIFSSIGDFIIGITLIIYAKKSGRKGNVGILYIVLYCIGRFLIEFFRSDYRGAIGVLSTSQFISLIVMILGSIYLFLKRRKKSDSEDTDTEINGDL